MDTPSVPQPHSTTPPPRRYTTVAILLLIGPTALIVLAIIAYALINFLSASPSPSNNTELFASASPMHTIGNVILFLVGALATVTWLPGLIIGIILLTKKR